MNYKIIELECPGCGAVITTETEICPKCYRPIIISTFNSISGLTTAELNQQVNMYRNTINRNAENTPMSISMAFCYLKLKLYDKAIFYFEKSIEENFDNSEVYFYAAIALLRGHKAFVAPRTVIDKAEEYLNGAIMIEERGIYYYFDAYIRYDHHYRKCYRVTPDYQELLVSAKRIGYSQTDVKELFELLGVDKPPCF